MPSPLVWHEPPDKVALASRVHVAQGPIGGPGAINKGLLVMAVIGYLDAGSGSMLLAAIAGGFAGIAVLVRLYWNRFLGLFSSRRRAAAAEAQAELMGTGSNPANPDE
jgi:hypothetical protein